MLGLRRLDEQLVWTKFQWVFLRRNDIPFGLLESIYSELREASIRCLYFAFLVCVFQWRSLVVTRIFRRGMLDLNDARISFFQRVVYIVGFNWTLEKLFLGHCPNDVTSHLVASVHPAGSWVTRLSLADSSHWLETVVSTRAGMDLSTGWWKGINSLGNRNLLYETDAAKGALCSRSWKLIPHLPLLWTSWVTLSNLLSLSVASSAKWNNLFLTRRKVDPEPQALSEFFPPKKTSSYQLVTHRGLVTGKSKGSSSV